MAEHGRHVVLGNYTSEQSQEPVEYVLVRICVS